MSVSHSAQHSPGRKCCNNSPYPQAYRADANIRDYAGKKPRQYMIIGDTAGMGLSISNDTFRQLKDRRKNRASRNEKNPGILRFGSLSVKVGSCHYERVFIFYIKLSLR